MNTRHPGFGRPCLMMGLDIDEPIPSLRVHDQDFAYLTVLRDELPIERLFIGTPMPRYPASWLADQLADRMNERLRREVLLASVEPARRATTLPSASIVVATRDRPEMLEGTLRSLSNCEGDASVVVVDNGADPRTRSVAVSSGATYIREPITGHSRARNRGWLACDTEVVIFTDDDVKVHPGWLRELLLGFEDPLVVATTGLILPAVLETTPQLLFELHAGFVRGFEPRTIDGSRSDAFKAPSAGAGAALAVRRAELSELGGFFEPLGGGTATRSGEDHHILHRILTRGWRVAYRPTAVAYHTHRTTHAELEQQLCGYGTGSVSYLLATKREEPLPGWFLIGVRGMATSLLRRSARAALHPTHPLRGRLATAEIRGALNAPSAYVRARRRHREALPPDEPLRGSTTWQDRLASKDELSVEVTDQLPTMSVVIPTRNRRDAVRRLVLALQTQRYPASDLEIIVALDGDVDDTAASLATLDSSVPLRCTQLPSIGRDADHGHGAGPTRNSGAAVAANTLLLFLDDDVTPRNDDFLLAHAAAHTSSSVVGIGPVPPTYDSEASYLTHLHRAWWVDLTTALETHEPDFSSLTSANLSIRRSVFEEHGGFADLERREDWELGYRLLARGATIRYLAQAAAVHHVEPSLESFLADTRREGAGDAGFLQRHPEAFGALPLSRWGEMARDRRRIVSAAIDGHEVLGRTLAATAPAALRTLERAGLRPRFRRLLTHLTTLAYWSGVGDRLGSFQEWRRLWGRAASRAAEDGYRGYFDLITGDLHRPRPGEVQALELRADDRVVGVGPVAWGGSPWQDGRFAETALQRFGHRAGTRDAISALQLPRARSTGEDLVPTVRDHASPPTESEGV